RRARPGRRPHRREWRPRIGAGTRSARLCLAARPGRAGSRYGMSALLDSLASGFDGDAARREALDAALRDGLPLVRSEAWKYTPLRALDRRSFVPAAAAAFDTALLEGIPAPRMVFVNGRYDSAHSDLSGLPSTVKLLTLAEALADPDPRASNFMQRRYARVDEV